MSRDVLTTEILLVGTTAGLRLAALFWEPEQPSVSLPDDRPP